MKLAIHKSSVGFHPAWEKFCKDNDIPYKMVDCYSNNIVQQLEDCTVLFWHHNQGNPKDVLIAKQILFALEHTGMRVFPDFRTAWHFDDKIAQKYLLERIGVPMVASYVFFDKKEALEWLEQTTFPKVFKLRGGAGSANVKLVKTKSQAVKMVKKAFGRGFSNYDAVSNLKERVRKFRVGKTTFFDVMKGVIRLVYPPQYALILGRQRGHVYFQDFIPNNDSDTRIIVIGERAFALKRFVRENDFRASGSGNFKVAREEFDERCVKIAFEVSDKLKTQCTAYDFIFDANNNPLLVEISYGFIKEVYYPCPGYWDKNLKWHEGQFIHPTWQIEEEIRKISE